MPRAPLSTVPPPFNSPDYSPQLAEVAKSIIYRSPIPSPSGLPIYILSAAALPDAKEVHFDALLPYVLGRLPDEDELLSGQNYEIVFFAGGGGDGATAVKKTLPNWGWMFQAFQALSRALRKRLQKLYIVHERAWVRLLVDAFSTVASPKSSKKIVHASTISSLALQIPIEDLLIPPSAYIHDRRLTPEIYAPYVSGRRAFRAPTPLPRDKFGRTRLPRVLRETTSFILIKDNIETEGIFRISPHSILISVLHEAYDRGQRYILWKDNGVMLPYQDCGNVKDAQSIIDEVDFQDAYGINLAASLVKVWYRDLRQPIFCVSSYERLQEAFSNLQEPPPIEKIVDLLSDDSSLNIISPLSREILVRHLLPMLSIVDKHSEANKMTAQNLAVCFAPTLLRGPDQLQDAKASSVIRHILEAAITMWDKGLRDALEIKTSTFSRDLQPPESPEDYEDPLEDNCKMQRNTEEHDSSGTQDGGDTHSQVTGITSSGADDPSSSSTSAPCLVNTIRRKPAPPPRPLSSELSNDEESHDKASTSGEGEKVRRKPAPALAGLPRYSALIAGESLAFDPDYTGASGMTADGFAPPPPASASNTASLNPWDDEKGKMG